LEPFLAIYLAFYAGVNRTISFSPWFITGEQADSAHHQVFRVQGFRVWVHLVQMQSPHLDSFHREMQQDEIKENDEKKMG